MLTPSEEWKFHLIFAHGSESSREWKYQGAKVPCMELSLHRSWEQKYVGTKVPVTPT